MNLDIREIKARFDDRSIRVYQAYGKDIAEAALRNNRFVSPFKMERMTWIKPSFNWMMYRSGYAKKPGQEYVLAIDISCEGFDWAVENAVLSHFVPEIHGDYDCWKELLANSEVRVQWDPARDWRINEIAGERAIQIGLSKSAVQKYVNEWILSITDVTSVAHAVDESRRLKQEPSERPDLLERVYAMSETAKLKLCSVTNQN